MLIEKFCCCPLFMYRSIKTVKLFISLLFSKFTVFTVQIKCAKKQSISTSLFIITIFNFPIRLKLQSADVIILNDHCNWVLKMGALLYLMCVKWCINVTKRKRNFFLYLYFFSQKREKLSYYFFRLEFTLTARTHVSISVKS